MEAIYLILGVLLVALVYWDLFESIVVPRPTPGWFRIGRYVVWISWRVVRAIGNGRGGRRHETLLGLYAPAATALLLVVWLAALILGFGLIGFGLRDQLRPVPEDLGTALYFAATTVLTLGGDIAAAGPLARIAVVLGAASGLGVVALVVTFLFSLYGSYQRREIQVVRLQGAAGAPPSAVALLETYARLGLVGRLPALFAAWESWAAEVLDSHVAYPLLGFFRSSHDNLSWISSLGTVLDAASLVLTTIEGVPTGEAELFRRAGSHLAEDISNLGYRADVTSGGNGTEDEAALDRAAFD
ncbi:MAG TPA: potassium channel family protein, partial [Candidatus Limnocylindrales bacterium]|nr:potassium channel family protein [Candidatus Limnocylindrales bacterium]